MNGFNVIELEEPGVLQRIFGRKPKANALREIQNLLAQKSFYDLTGAAD